MKNEKPNYVGAVMSGPAGLVLDGITRVLFSDGTALDMREEYYDEVFRSSVCHGKVKSDFAAERTIPATPKFY